MKRKAVSLVLALTMVASVVAGCGSKQEAATTEPTVKNSLRPFRGSPAKELSRRCHDF